MSRKISDQSLQLDALDGLRGAAALIVILSHTSNASMFFLPFLDARGSGKSGVFLFFLLSSFLLSRALIKQGVGAYSLSSINHYAQRRFFRIYPLYILYLLLGVISTVIFSEFLGQQNKGVPFSLSVREFLNHIFLIQGKGVTWSIAVEFKFYFVLPLLIFFCYLIKSKFSYFIEILFLLSLIILTQLVSPQSESLVNDSRLLPYLCIFLIGTILATIQCEIEAGNIDRTRIKPIVWLSYCSVLILVFITPEGASLIFGEVDKDHFHKYFIQHAILWGIILLSIINFNSKLSSIFKMKILGFYGALSFSIYLFHPTFVSIAKYLALDQYFSAWFVLLSSTVASYISYRFLELPVSKFKTSFNKSNNSVTANRASS